MKSKAYGNLEERFPDIVMKNCLLPIGSSIFQSYASEQNLLSCFALGFCLCQSSAGNWPFNLASIVTVACYSTKIMSPV